MALLRGQLRARRLLTSAEVRDSPHGRSVRTAGIVIGRQRPDTASGVIFVTLEDETGATNVIVWRDLSDRQRRELLGARLMGVYGRVEREGIVVTCSRVGSWTSRPCWDRCRLTRATFTENNRLDHPPLPWHDPPARGAGRLARRSSKMAQILFKNAKLLDPRADALEGGVSVLVDGETILEVSAKRSRRPTPM